MRVEIYLRQRQNPACRAIVWLDKIDRNAMSYQEVLFDRRRAAVERVTEKRGKTG
jgi:hypothetical protein